MKLGTLNKKEKASNWLMIIAICVSVLSFSGLAISSSPQHPSTSPIELVLLNLNQSIGRDISFEKSLVLAKCIVDVPAYHHYEIYSLLVHNMITTVRLKTISKQINSVKVFTCFVQIKTIPQDSDPPDNSSLIG